MPYIAFFDMLGTRSSATISSDAYAKAIDGFHNKIRDALSQRTGCEIYGYSDNAYMQFADLDNMIEFFRQLRRALLIEHTYFSAAVGVGKLNASVMQGNESRSKKKTSNKGSIMMFPGADTVQVYSDQSRFSGIGIALSQQVVRDMNETSKKDEYRESICINEAKGSIDKSEVVRVFDISYRGVTTEEMNAVISDYILAALMNERAGRYYLTPLITMIRSMSISSVEKEIDNICRIIQFSDYEEFVTIKRLPYDKSILLFTLIDRILREDDPKGSFEKKKIIERIVSSEGIVIKDLMKELPSIPIEIIPNDRKRSLVELLYYIFRERLDLKRI